MNAIQGARFFYKLSGETAVAYVAQLTKSVCGITASVANLHTQAHTHTHLQIACLSLQRLANYLNMERLLDWDHSLNCFDTEMTGSRTEAAGFHTLR